MIIRLVKLTFRTDKKDTFISLFNQYKEQIRNFPGCMHLELWQDADCKEVFTTYSIWEEEESLERYRKSELFAKVWAETKAMFSEKPFAYSSVKIVEA